MFRAVDVRDLMPLLDLYLLRVKALGVSLENEL